MFTTDDTERASTFSRAFTDTVSGWTRACSGWDRRVARASWSGPGAEWAQGSASRPRDDDVLARGWYRRLECAHCHNPPTANAVTTRATPIAARKPSPDLPPTAPIRAPRAARRTVCPCTSQRTNPSRLPARRGKGCRPLRTSSSWEAPPRKPRGNGGSERISRLFPIPSRSPCSAAWPFLVLVVSPIGRRLLGRSTLKP